MKYSIFIKLGSSSAKDECTSTDSLRLALEIATFYAKEFSECKSEQNQVTVCDKNGEVIYMFSKKYGHVFTHWFDEI